MASLKELQQAGMLGRQSPQTNDVDVLNEAKNLNAHGRYNAAEQLLAPVHNALRGGDFWTIYAQSLYGLCRYTSAQQALEHVPLSERGSEQLRLLGKIYRCMDKTALAKNCFLQCYAQSGRKQSNFDQLIIQDMSLVLIEMGEFRCAQRWTGAIQDKVVRDYHHALEAYLQNDPIKTSEILTPYILGCRHVPLAHLGLYLVAQNDQKMFEMYQPLLRNEGVKTNFERFAQDWKRARFLLEHKDEIAKCRNLANNRHSHSIRQTQFITEFRPSF